MDATTFSALALACAPAVHASTTHALVAVESRFNPHAIGVVGGVLDRQPRTRAEALATAERLLADGWNFSLGLAQINRRNFDRLGLTPATALDPCANLRAMQAVLDECFERASQRAAPQSALRQSLSCYYSGNFVTGFRHGYVQRVAQRVMQAAATGRRVSGVPP
ncbi:lytic transglycosylase domain-containing protein [Ideonella sp. A 288]|uniref:lytic transglycosylase domain-containing protein n=1 Tax=Ideonella sp. A 288 TaxID=1962181 RepID=UPI000B4B052D|nr:lytic transglycosylase domain-containing protein [Ideonella sp. A 288]